MGDSINYWWLNLNRDIWDVSKFPVGHIEEQRTHNPEGKKRRVYSYFRAVSPADLIVAYESSPTKRFVAILKVTKGIHKGVAGEVIDFEIIEKLKRTIGWDEIKKMPGLKSSEPVKINNRGSIFRLTEDEYQTIMASVKK